MLPVILMILLVAGAFVLFVLSYKKENKPMFWSGLAALCIAYGIGIVGYYSHWF